MNNFLNMPDCYHNKSSIILKVKGKEWNIRVSLATEKIET